MAQAEPEVKMTSSIVDKGKTFYSRGLVTGFGHPALVADQLTPSIMTRILRPLSSAWRAIGGSALLLIAVLGLSACSTTPPDGITAVTPFDVNRYQGKWYEIARMDHSFEKGLSDVSAHYQIQADGSVKVINRGFSKSKGKWSEAVGRALFTGDPQRASLKVSFFGPFYGGYHVVALDQQDYRWALVVGPDRDYVWILARDKQLPAAVREQLLAKARQLGIAVEALIWVDQTRQED